MEKIIEHTDGNHIYMKLKVDGRIEEIDYYVSSDTYKTTGDGTERREKIIEAFKKLY